MNDPSRPPPSYFRSAQLHASYDDPATQVQDEINLLGMCRIILRYRAMVLGITLVVTTAAITVAYLMTPVYRAEVLLAPVRDEQQNSMTTLAGRLSGLTSLAGINLQSSSSNSDEVLAKLVSKRFIGQSISANQLMPVLYEDSWDNVAKKWKVDETHSPSTLDAHTLFRKSILSVDINKSGLITLAVQWKDPQQAALWANAGKQVQT